MAQHLPERFRALTAALIADLRILIGFFSRIPLPAAAAPEGEGAADAAPDLPRAVAVIPVAGLVLALPGIAVLVLLGWTHLPVMATAALAIAACGLATGFLHEDGLSDTADGLIGGKSREHRLEIMRDSRIGAFGAVALVLTLTLRIVLLAAVLERLGPGSAILALALTQSLSRVGMILFWAGLPPARGDGLSASIGQPLVASVLTALSIGGAFLVIAMPVFGIAGPILGIGIGGAVLILLSIYADNRIGGQTGDVLGAMQQLGEIAILIGLLV